MKEYSAGTRLPSTGLATKFCSALGGTKRRRNIYFAPRNVMWVAAVAKIALALKAALLVGAALGADAHLGALVHVCSM